MSDLDLDFWAIVYSTWCRWEIDAQEQYAQDVEAGRSGVKL